MKKLSQAFYQQSCETVARELLGCYLVHQLHDKTQIARIVETEAYLGPHDLACHTSKGRTQRTEVMFGPAGHAYVYLIYGIHHCTNVVAEGGAGAAVLLRALEPLQNIDDKTQGPGLLSRAMHIDLSLNGQDLQSEHFHIARPEQFVPPDIVCKPRIGVHYAKEWADKPLRFYIKDNPWVSKF